jgi:hypothetical protein
MLNFLPLLLLVLIVFLAKVISRSRLTIGNQWLILVLAILLAWSAIFAMRVYLPDPVSVKEWLPASTGIGALTFSLDAISWTFSFALFTLLAGMVLVDTIHLHERSYLGDWSRVILLFGFLVFSALVNSLLAFILSWTILDIVELVVEISDRKDGSISTQVVLIFFAHLIGTFLLLAALILRGVNDLTNLQPLDATLLILGAGLRMTFVSSKDQYPGAHSLSENLESVRKVMSPFLAMVFLSRFTFQGEVKGVLALLFVGSVLIVLYSSIKWFIASDAIKGNSYWIISLSGLAMVSALRGHPESVVGWAVIMLVLGGWGRFYASRPNKMIYFLAIVALSMAGLPFTPTSGAYFALLSGPMVGFNVFLWISLAFLIAGVLRSALKPAENGKNQENWMKLFYFVSLALVTIAPWLPEIWQAKSLNLDTLWISFFVIIVLALILVFTYAQKAREWLIVSIPTRLKATSIKMADSSDRALSMGWFPEIVESILEFAGRLINSFNSILEGEGGILWAFVFLALLISLMMSKLSG